MLAAWPEDLDRNDFEGGKWGLSSCQELLVLGAYMDLDLALWDETGWLPGTLSIDSSHFTQAQERVIIDCPKR